MKSLHVLQALIAGWFALTCVGGSSRAQTPAGDPAPASGGPVDPAALNQSERTYFLCSTMLPAPGLVRLSDRPDDLVEFRLGEQLQRGRPQVSLRPMR